MKRSAPLKRRTPLHRRTRRLPDGVRESVFARANSRCDLCGAPLPADAFHAHHRRRRSQGGADDPLNLVALHPECHQWIHEHVRAARVAGFLVPSVRHPAFVPVYLHAAAWVLPSADAWQPVPGREVVT